MADNNSIYCVNCRQHTHLTIQTEVSRHSRLYQIAECNSCNFLYLIKRLSHDSQINDIYPNQLPKPLDNRIPTFLKNDIKEAYDCFSINAYRATGALARRALQICCIEKGAPDRRLEEQIDWLLDKQIINKDLYDWAHEVRLIGNDSAHPPKDIHNDFNVSKNDAEDILTLLDKIVEFLYITPAIINDRRSKKSSDI